MSWFVFLIYYIYLWRFCTRGIIPQEETNYARSNMFFGKSSVVLSFTTIRKCASECDGIVALHTDGKVLQTEIDLALISRNRRNATSQLRKKLNLLCTLSNPVPLTHTCTIGLIYYSINPISTVARLILIV